MQNHRLDDSLDHLIDDSRSLWVPQRIREYGPKGRALQFLRDHVAQSVPCVWRGAVEHWPASRKWKDQNHSYLQEKLGHKIVEVAWTPDGRADSIVDIVSTDVTPGMVFAMPEQRKQPFGDVLKTLSEYESGSKSNHDERDDQVPNSGIPYYSAQDSSLTRDLPELLDDIDESVIEFATEAFGADASATNIWCGDERSVTTMHADPFENIYAVVTGTKIFRLRPPCDAAVLSKPTLPCARWEMRKEEDTVEKEQILRTKRKYPGWSLMKEEGKTSWINERAIDERCGNELVVRVEAGDLLFLPALWFHQVSQRGITMAVNWWYEMNFGRDWVYSELCYSLREIDTMRKAGRENESDYGGHTQNALTKI